MTAIKYELARGWMRFDVVSLITELAEAKAAVMSLTNTPFQRSWAEKLQDMQLKREIAGTSRIEGAEFTEVEFEQALKESTTEELFTRSQKQARAAKLTYQWIAELPEDRPIDERLITEIHRRIITGADDDHCPAGQIRNDGQNVMFGIPRHRGAEGGKECEIAFNGLVKAIQREFQDYDILIQALSMHYHFASIHPFIDGNGRTARALEALVLQRAGLRDSLFIAMSNYYYDEKTQYLNALSASRALNHDLTPFLKFGLRGIALQCRRLYEEIKRHLGKALYKNVMYDLFNRLKNTRKRVIAERQIKMLNLLLEEDEMLLRDFFHQMYREYNSLAVPMQAISRDLTSLLNIGAVDFVSDKKGTSPTLVINLDWATRITETKFFEEISKLPKAKTYPFLN
ncbi:MAG: Fic family protein [Acidobacteria bacterium]|nr:Fic family protein [Acidobacteriota bacterium]MCA1637397.1 Fic family protein [Acidobacteriota bacterium]